MDATFSQLMCATEGRFMTGVEEQQALLCSLELPRRMRISRMLQECEASIVDFATNAFCDIIGDFEGAEGSSRRKKGHQDGRIILRYVAQAIRERSTNLIYEKVLSWLVGHLDNRNVTAKHMEVFFHFLSQGVRRELPDSMHAIVDSVFEGIICFVRNGRHSGEILSAHRRIAEFAVDRVLSILPEARAKFGATSAPKCKRDFEFLAKEIARVVKSPTRERMKEELSKWMLERLASHVEYDAKVWYWTALAMREAVTSCCGPEAGRSVHDLLDELADRSEELVTSVHIMNSVGDIASHVSERLLDRGEPLGILRADEFKNAIAMVNRELIATIAILNVCGDPPSQVKRLSELWCAEVVTHMPYATTNLLAANLQEILRVAQETQTEEVVGTLRRYITTLVEIARRNETAERLSKFADQVAADAAEWSSSTLSASAAESRACYRDVRIVLAKAIGLMPSGPSAVNGHVLQRYVAEHLLPNKPASAQIMQQTFLHVIQCFERLAGSDDAKSIRGYLESLFPVFERFARIHGISDNIDKMTIPAVERGYQSSPRHESLRRHGIEAGRRDGSLLMEKILTAAIVGGAAAEDEVQHYFFNEIVHFSRLPGGVVIEFLRGLHEQVRDYPEVAEIVLGLSRVAAQFTASIKIDAVSDDLGNRVAERSVLGMPNYRQSAGDAVVDACARDYSIAVRGLATFLVQSPLDVEPFKKWWMKRVGRNLHVKPDGFDPSNPWGVINRSAIVDVMREYLDAHEVDAVEAYLAAVTTRPRENVKAWSQSPIQIPNPAQPTAAHSLMTFADVEV